MASKSNLVRAKASKGPPASEQLNEEMFTWGVEHMQYAPRINSKCEISAGHLKPICQKKLAKPIRKICQEARTLQDVHKIKGNLHFAKWTKNNPRLNPSNEGEQDFLSTRDSDLEVKIKQSLGKLELEDEELENLEETFRQKLSRHKTRKHNSAVLVKYTNDIRSRDKMDCQLSSEFQLCSNSLEKQNAHDQTLYSCQPQSSTLTGRLSPILENRVGKTVRETCEALHSFQVQSPSRDADVNVSLNSCNQGLSAMIKGAYTNYTSADIVAALLELANTNSSNFMLDREEANEDQLQTSQLNGESTQPALQQHNLLELDSKFALVKLKTVECNNKTNSKRGLVKEQQRTLDLLLTKTPDKIVEQVARSFFKCSLTECATKASLQHLLSTDITKSLQDQTETFHLVWMELNAQEEEICYLKFGKGEKQDFIKALSQQVSPVELEAKQKEVLSVLSAMNVDDTSCVDKLSKLKNQPKLQFIRFMSLQLPMLCRVRIKSRCVSVPMLTIHRMTELTLGSRVDPSLLELLLELGFHSYMSSDVILNLIRQLFNGMRQQQYRLECNRSRHPHNIDIAYIQELPSVIRSRRQRHVDKLVPAIDNGLAKAARGRKTLDRLREAIADWKEASAYRIDTGFRVEGMTLLEWQETWKAAKLKSKKSHV